MLYLRLFRGKCIKIEDYVSFAKHRVSFINVYYICSIYICKRERI